MKHVTLLKKCAQALSTKKEHRYFLLVRIVRYAFANK